MAVLLAHRTATAPPTGSAALDTVFATALARDPADRYPTVAAFAAALDRALLAPAPKRARGRWLVAGGIAVAAAGAVAAFTLPGNNHSPSTPSTPDEWAAVHGPGGAAFRVPPDWRREATGAVVTFTDAGTQVLVVGGERGDAEPETDLRSLYECAGAVDAEPVAGLPAAACDVPGRHATVVASHGTIVRFAFEAAVPAADRDRVLASVTIG